MPVGGQVGLENRHHRERNDVKARERKVNEQQRDYDGRNQTEKAHRDSFRARTRTTITIKLHDKYT